MQAVARLVHAEWHDSLVREGLAPVGTGAAVTLADSDEPPCPACGSTAGLGSDGTCADCGLQLG